MQHTPIHNIQSAQDQKPKAENNNIFEWYSLWINKFFVFLCEFLFLSTEKKSMKEKNENGSHTY